MNRLCQGVQAADCVRRPNGEPVPPAAQCGLLDPDRLRRRFTHRGLDAEGLMPFVRHQDVRQLVMDPPATPTTKPANDELDLLS